VDEVELLGRMRDLHLPPPPALWPPAPGWWLLAVLAAAAAAALVWHLRRSGRRRRAALAELRRLEARWSKDGDAAGLAAGVSVLLRRVALAGHRRDTVAGLAGEDWLAWLDGGRGDAFSAGPGRALLTLPYGGGGGEHAAALLALARQWLRRCA
jgi:hypothetical protein